MPERRQGRTFVQEIAELCWSLELLGTKRRETLNMRVLFLIDSRQPRENDLPAAATQSPPPSPPRVLEPCPPPLANRSVSLPHLPCQKECRSRTSEITILFLDVWWLNSSLITDISEEASSPLTKPRTSTITSQGLPCAPETIHLFKMDRLVLL